MRPESSASGMKMSGGTKPLVGWCHRASASKEVTSPVFGVDDGLVVDGEGPVS